MTEQQPASISAACYAMKYHFLICVPFDLCCTGICYSNTTGADFCVSKGSKNGQRLQGVEER